MEFQNRVLTSDGRELIAQAISSNQRIIFVRAMSSTTYMDDTALVNLRVEDLTGPLGTIKTTSATGNVARIMTEFTNQPVSAKVMTVAVAARLAAQPDAAAIVMLAQSDPTAGIYIPSTAELSTSVQVAFNVVINATGEVEVTPSANVSLGDHERLLERTVTTHADGDPTVGEAQDIKGDKDFKDNVSIDGRLRIYDKNDNSCYADISFADDEGIMVTQSIVPAPSVLADIGEHWRCFNASFIDTGHFNAITAFPNSTKIDIGCSLVPNNDNVYAFGTSGKRFKEVYTNKAVADNAVTDKIILDIDRDETIENYIEGKGYSDHAYLEMRTVHSNHAGTGGSLFNQTVDVFSGGAHCKASTRIGFVGGPGGGVKVEYDTRNYHSQTPYKAVNVYLSCGDRNCVYNGECFSVYGSISCSYITINGGPIIDTDSNDNLRIDNNLMPSSTGDYALGSSDKKWSEVHALSFHGCIPYPTTPTTNVPPVGSIFLAFFEASFIGPSISYNDVVDASNLAVYGVAAMGIAYFEIPSGSSAAPGTEWNRYNTITTGRYVALSSAGSTNMNKLVCLMMRIE